MLRLAATVASAMAASSACGFAALGVALYAGSGQVLDAAGLFGAVGAVVGLASAGLHLALEGQPVAPAAPASAAELGRLVRAALASAGGAARVDGRPAAGTAGRPGHAPVPRLRNDANAVVAAVAAVVAARAPARPGDVLPVREVASTGATHRRASPMSSV